jgi:allantoinase
MKPRDRVAFSAIVDRPPLRLPAGLRLIVWPIINLEEWEIERPMARQVLPAPTGVPLLPDVPNWSWHEYGMRVGIWRFYEAFDRIGAKGTLSINAKVVESYPRVAAAAKERGWEFMGHSLVQGPIHKLDDQRAVIHQSLDLLQRFTGKRPVGWLGPGLTQTYETPELLAEAGVEYIGDWVYDDEPSQIRTAKGPLITLPYTVELNDIPMMIVQHHRADELLRRASDQFDRLYREAAGRAKILSIAIHPYITGVPHRIKYLEAFLDYAKGHRGVAFWTGEEILAWFRQQVCVVSPG